MDEEKIAADAASGTNWAELVNYGPTCICGAGVRTLKAAKALSAGRAKPTGKCSMHPGGTVLRQGEKWDEGIHD